MRVLVLGAGIMGTTTAYYLAREGHEVHVVDRQNEVAMETSRGNGGVLHSSEVEPWSSPGMPQKVIGWLGHDDAPMLLRPSALWSMWPWGLKFTRNCTLARYRRAAELNLRLSLLTLSEIRQIRQDLPIDYDLNERGTLKIYRRQDELSAAAADAEVLRSHGMDLELVSPARCVEIEPALASIAGQLAGGLFSARDENGDCHKFAVGLRRHLEESFGVTFHLGTTIDRLERSGDVITGVMTSKGRLTADNYVAALASFSSKLLRPVGVHVDIYPAKGVAVTVPATNWPDGPKLPVTEVSKLFGLIRIGDNYRCSGSVEFTGWDARPDPRRAKALVDNVISVFPEFERCYDSVTANVWAGLRPMPASGSPYVGRSSVSNLYLNCGHGHLGWTMSCGSSRAVADQMLGHPPAVDLDGLTPTTHL